MAKRKPGKAAMTVAECKGCTMIDGGVATKGACTTFLDPGCQWREGECWGKCASAEEMVKRLEAMVRYNDIAGTNTAGIAALRRELRGWQETVRELATEAI